MVADGPVADKSLSGCTSHRDLWLLPVKPATFRRRTFSFEEGRRCRQPAGRRARRGEPAVGADETVGRASAMAVMSRRRCSRHHARQPTARASASSGRAAAALISAARTGRGAVVPARSGRAASDGTGRAAAPPPGCCPRHRGRRLGAATARTLSPIPQCLIPQTARFNLTRTRAPALGSGRAGFAPGGDEGRCPLRGARAVRARAHPPGPSLRRARSGGRASDGRGRLPDRHGPPGGLRPGGAGLGARLRPSPVSRSGRPLAR